MFLDYHNPNDYWQHNPMTKDDQNVDPDEAMKSGCFVLVFYIVAFIVGVALCALLGSCTTTKYVPVIEHKTDTVIQTKVQHDSIHVKDSTIVEKRDSIIKIEHWHTKYVEKQVHDTLYQSKTDTVPQPYPVIKEVEKPLTKTQTGLMIVGCLSMMALIMYIAIKIKRFLPLR